MSQKGQNPPLAGLHQKKSLGISCVRTPADEGAAKAPTALVFGLPRVEEGVQTLSISLGYFRSADQSVWQTDSPMR